MIYPIFPSAGDTIGICAPSAGVGHKLESFDKSLAALKSIGFNIIETESVRKCALKASSGPIRAREFNSLVSNEDIKLILSASGGDYNMEILPFIDTENFIKNPKWVVGASDPTNIVYFLTTKYDIASIYGVNAGTFDWEPMHIFQTNALNILQGILPLQRSFDLYDSNRDFSKSGQILDGKVEWKIYFPGGVQADRLDVSGRLIGGCSDVISNLMGTPYDCASDFISRYADDGIIWYFDPFVTDPIQLHLMLLKFKYAGYFEHTNALIIGRIMFPGDYSDYDYIDEIKDDLDFPIIWGADIGHVKPCMTLINGSVARVICQYGKASLEMSLV